MFNKRPAADFISAGLVASAIAIGATNVTAVDMEYYGRRNNSDGKRELGAWRGRDSIATGNRHGGAHQHKREIARRLRQQA